MADDKERLIVQLEARINEFEKRMKKAERTGTRSYTRLRTGSGSATRAMERDMLRSTSAINRALATTSSKIGAFGRTMAAGFVAGAATAALAKLSTDIAGTVKGIAEIGNEAKRSGLSAQAFQEWSFVAEQNRIGVDQLVDGFKELNLRADEFIVTGGGPAAEAFQRLSLGADRLKRGLEDPSELMLDIIDRLEGMDRAAQIRIADEVFGGSAGERFVELLDQGAEGLRRTITQAHQVGAVMDDAMIAKADELDRRFNELSVTVGNFGKRAAVAFAGIATEATDLRAKLDRLFPSEAQGRAVLGDDFYDVLNANRDVVDEAATDITELRKQFAGLGDEANQTAAALEQSANLARAWGYADVAQTLSASAMEMRRLAGEFAGGTIEADAFAEELGVVQTNALGAFEALDEADKVDFSNAIAQVQALGSVIGQVLTVAAALGSAIREAAGMGASLPVGPQNGRGRGIPVEIRPGEFAPESSIRPQRPSVDASFGVPDAPKSRGGGGKGGGGGRSRADDYAREAEAIRDKTAALNAEAAALAAVAVSGGNYAAAIDLARTKAELLHAAQKAGKEITPELEAEINRLAQAYVEAGTSAEEAAGKLNEIEAAAERGAGALSDIFMGVIDGSKSAKEAVGELLMEIARVQMMQAFLGVSGMGGGNNPVAMLGKMLSFDGGGYTGSGSRTGGLDGKGGFPAILHPRETVTDHTKGGGGAQDIRLSVEVDMDAQGRWQGYVRDVSRSEADSATRAGLQHYDRHVAPKTAARIRKDPRRVG
ncbi:hypothetical protein [Tropicimonas isoalkanivorans]|uniref:Phage tail tape measure protein, lambda family n=1 Tax=Tropicimonas isoalkanivorans TaxID=441112 RepID=A0A1I1E512_9RHOB|nr:hypothetical protein [Tropicimonas isoalkanivorans]SFB82194.1 hypothetical protein SAMN04488094_101641 [Tropicimonas isoalkanivorans]